MRAVGAVVSGKTLSLEGGEAAMRSISTKAALHSTAPRVYNLVRG